MDLVCEIPGLRGQVGQNLEPPFNEVVVMFLSPRDAPTNPPGVLGF